MPKHLLLPSISQTIARRAGQTILSITIAACSAILSSCSPVEAFFDLGSKHPAATAATGAARVPSERRAAAMIKPQQQEPQRMAAMRRNSQPPIKPTQLTGLDPKAMSTLLGRPSSIQKRDVKYVWAYDGPSCVLRVVFYPDIETKQLHVLQTVVQDPRGRPLANAAPCLRGIRSKSQ